MYSCLNFVVYCTVTLLIVCFHCFRYLDFWVDHPVWSGDYSDVVLDNLYHHYVQTKDYGHWIFKDVMVVTGTIQLMYLLLRCWKIGNAADWIFLVCNTGFSICFLTTILPNRDAMSAIGKSYQTSDEQRLQFMFHVNRLAKAHVICFVCCLGGILVDYYTVGSLLLVTFRRDATATAVPILVVSGDNDKPKKVA